MLQAGDKHSTHKGGDSNLDLKHPGERYRNIQESGPGELPRLAVRGMKRGANFAESRTSALSE